MLRSSEVERTASALYDDGSNVHSEIRLLMRRIADAVRDVEGRLRSIELIVAAGEDRFIGFAVDDYERAAERLRSLEVARSLALLEAGMAADVDATTLVHKLDDTDGNLARIVSELRNAVDDLDATRTRAREVVARAASSVRARTDASRMLTGSTP